MKNNIHKSSMYIDSHAHITSDELYPSADLIIKRACAQGVKVMINIATCEKTLERGLLLAKKYPEHIFNTAATTPHDVEKEGEMFFPIVRKAALEGDLVAIGETGLDYYYEHSDRALQKHFLEKYFDLAEESLLPVVIHCRGDEAFADLFAIAKKRKKLPKVLLHCFTGNQDQAKEIISLGWMISMSGIVTFKKSVDLREVLKTIPLSHLVIETDSPYLAPQSHRGKINEPAYVIEIAEVISTTLNLPLEKVCEETTRNSWSFFQLFRRLEEIQ